MAPFPPETVERVLRSYCANMQHSNTVEKVMSSINVLVIDDNPYMRKITRNLLVNIGVKNIHEAADGIAGLETIRALSPDIVLCEWEMPFLNGAELLRIVRSPGVFPVPDVPIIMLSAHGQRWRVLEAVRLGAHEYIKKPVSGKVLLDRMVSIFANPRPMVRIGEFYGPEPRRHDRPKAAAVQAAPSAPQMPSALMPDIVAG